MLGLGVSHGELSPRYAHPYSAMQRYLSGLDTANDFPFVPAEGIQVSQLARLTHVREQTMTRHPVGVSGDAAWPPGAGKPAQDVSSFRAPLSSPKKTP